MGLPQVQTDVNIQARLQGTFVLRMCSMQYAFIYFVSKFKRTVLVCVFVCLLGVHVCMCVSDYVNMHTEDKVVVFFFLFPQRIKKTHRQTNKG